MNHRAALAALAIATGLVGALASPMPALADELEDVQQAVAEEAKIAEDASEKVDDMAENPDDRQATEAAVRALGATPSSVGDLLASYSGQNAQLIFAQLQMQLAQQNKQQAMEKIESIREQQEKDTAYSELLNELRKLEAKLPSTKGDTTVGVKLTKTVTDLASGLGYAIPAPEDAQVGYTKDELGQLISDVESARERSGTDTLQQMVYIQDFMGNYSSYLQDAADAVAGAQEARASASRGTIDETDQNLAVQSELLSFISERADKIEELKGELGGLEPASADAQSIGEQIDTVLDELTMGCETLQKAQQSAAGTVSGATPDGFGMAALGAGAGAVIGGGAVALVMRRRGARSEQKD